LRRQGVPHRINGPTLAFLLALVLVASGCGNFDVIRDIRELPQNHFAYLPWDNDGRLRVDKDWQEEMKERYLENHFLPWRGEAPRVTADEVKAAWLPFVPDPDDGSRSARRRRSRIRRAAANTGLRNYPNASQPGITAATVHLRHLPMAPPPADAPGRTGGRDPLDKLQVSSVPPGTPVHIYHFSKDGVWALVETGFARGWTKRKGLAAVDPDFMRRWERGPQAVIVRDKTPLRRRDGRFLYRAPLGALFPMAAPPGEKLEVCAPVRGKGGRVRIHTAVLSGGEAAAFPLPLTAANLATLGNELIREPYGWGGMNGRRDCSAMIRDFLAPFGIWLPRHSADQAREGGTFVDLTNLATAEKKRLIADRGIPYLTLLWIKGHIMLYVGSPSGEPLVFHNFWSVRTISAAGRPGRKIVGRAAITTLYPGREFNGAADPEGPYLAYLQGMTLIGPVIAVRLEN